MHKKSGKVPPYLSTANRKTWNHVNSMSYQQRKSKHIFIITKFYSLFFFELCTIVKKILFHSNDLTNFSA